MNSLHLESRTSNKKVLARAARTASLWVPKIKSELSLAWNYFFFFAVFLAAFFFAGMDASWKTFSLEGFRFGSLNLNRHATN